MTRIKIALCKNTQTPFPMGWVPYRCEGLSIGSFTAEWMESASSLTRTPLTAPWPNAFCSATLSTSKPFAFRS